MPAKERVKKTSGRTAKKEKAAPQPKSSARQDDPALKVRMYRQGLGDCFLVTLPGSKGAPFYVLIDCGVVLGTPDAVSKMNKVVDDIAATTAGRIDLLIITHEHYDHLSGFIQAREAFEKKLKIMNLWFAWTEDPEDPLANRLRAEHLKMRIALAAACARMRFEGGTGSVDGLLEFFGAAAQGSTGQALEEVRRLCTSIRYCRPQDPPVEPEGSGARFYVLGPPPDEKMIKKFNPSKSHPETYGLAMQELEKMSAGKEDLWTSAPFDPVVQVPMEMARQMPFFQSYYWGEYGAKDQEGSGEERTGVEKDQSWRKIDGEWLSASSELALQLDSATNNTSLVIAIELASGEVLLFAADAQVGNWLSWQALSWQVEGQAVTGTNLLERTILYKTGHHGSHNATLQENGLELMKKLKFALIPVDHEMAVKKGWGNIPLGKLEERLRAITNNAVLRIDQEIPPVLTGRVTHDPDKRLYYELTI